MANFNKVVLVGNLTRDPDVRQTPGGMSVTDLGLAVNRTWTDRNTNQRNEETTFVDVTCWGRTAEIAGEYLSKGRAVLIEGRLKLDEWNDRESGQRRTKLKVVCENMQMLGGRADGGGGGGGGGGDWNQQPAAPAEAAPAEAAPAGDGPASSPAEDDEVPF